MMQVTILSAVLMGASLLAGIAEAQPKAGADIKNAAGKTIGEALLEQREGEVQITATYGPHAGDLPNLDAPCSTPTARPSSSTRGPTTTSRIPLAMRASGWPAA
jgi:hypothetical protein